MVSEVIKMLSHIFICVTHIIFRSLVRQKTQELLTIGVSVVKITKIMREKERIKIAKNLRINEHRVQCGMKKQRGSSVIVL